MVVFSRRLRYLAAATLWAAVSVHADDWPQWLGPGRQSIWRETGIVDGIPAEGPKVSWRVPLGSGYSGPAVAKGKVFVMDFSPQSGKSTLDFNNRDRIRG